MESHFSICPGGGRLNEPICVAPVSPRIGEPRRRADGPRCTHAFVADARLVCRHARHRCLYRWHARFGCVARMVGARAQEAGRPRRPSPVADFGDGRETGHRRRRDTSSGRGAGGSQPKVARHPGEGAVYRSRHLRSRRVREDLGLHEPVCPAVARLASHKSEAPGGRARPRSEGGFLLRHPEDSRRGGPGRRLHGDQPGRQISVEPPGPRTGSIPTLWPIRCPLF